MKDKREILRAEGVPISEEGKIDASYLFQFPSQA